MIKEIVIEFKKYRNAVFLVFAFFMTATFAFFAASGMDKTTAVSSASGFKAGNIISDAVMANYNSMSLNDIQNFLTSKNPCKNRDYNYYLKISKDSPDVKWHWKDDHFVCLSEERFGNNDNEIGEGQTAAEIIYEAAQDYKINPQVLMVLLEKETSLITDPIPNDFNYRRATGYGCPDTAACSSQYYGFKNQVRNAAWLFRYTLDNGYRGFPEKTHGVRVGYHPNASCGSSEVYIENRATAALYRYTPYQPNAASLAAGTGYGDKCSSYGNRNFYIYFNNWFGSTQARVEGEVLDLPDGEYTITSKISTGRTIAANGLNNGSNVQLGSLNDSDKNQRWKFTRKANSDYYIITNVASGKALDVADGNTTNGGNIQTWDYVGNCQQEWRIYRTADGYYTFETACSSGVVLDLYSGMSNIGTNAQVYLSNASAAQKFTLRAGRTVEDGIYTVQSGVKDSYVVDLYAGSRSNKANIQVWSGNSTLAQRWMFTYDETGDYYTITNPLSGKVLDVANGSMKYGSNIQSYTSNGTCAQQWKIIPGTNGATIISNCHYGKALDLSSGKAANGGNIQLWNYDRYASAQRWLLVPEQKLANGEYIFHSSHDQEKLVDLPDNAIKNGNPIQLWSNANTPQQRWYLEQNDDGITYTIYSDAQNKMSIDVLWGVISNSTGLQLYSANNTCAQQWYAVKLNNGYSFLSACDTHYAIDVPGGNTQNGSKLNLFEANDTNAQKFNLTKLSN